MGNNIIILKSVWQISIGETSEVLCCITVYHGKCIEVWVLGQLREQHSKKQRQILYHFFQPRKKTTSSGHFTSAKKIHHFYHNLLFPQTSSYPSSTNLQLPFPHQHFLLSLPSLISFLHLSRCLPVGFVYAWAFGLPPSSTSLASGPWLCSKASTRSTACLLGRNRSAFVSIAVERNVFCQQPNPRSRIGIFFEKMDPSDRDLGIVSGT